MKEENDEAALNKFDKDYGAFTIDKSILEEAGCKSHWPSNRSVATSKDGSVVIGTAFEDHMLIVVTSKK